MSMLPEARAIVPDSVTVVAACVAVVPDCIPVVAGCKSIPITPATMAISLLTKACARGQEGRILGAS
ncbi:MAG TPA: hypothetical protein VF708_22020 [Pyrinomonadaceae bacterium]